MLPQLSAFYGRQLTSFNHEGIELRGLPVGLLVDLYDPELPWKIEVSDGWGGGLSNMKAVEDSWVNSVKEVSAISLRLLVPYYGNIFTQTVPKFPCAARLL